MANTVQAKKRARQAETHRERNTAQLSKVRTYIKSVLTAVNGKDKEKAQQAYRAASSVIDRAAGKGLLHKNVASRYKSRLNTKVRGLTTSG